MIKLIIFTENPEADEDENLKMVKMYFPDMAICGYEDLALNCPPYFEEIYYDMKKVYGLMNSNGKCFFLHVNSEIDVQYDE